MSDSMTVSTNNKEMAKAITPSPVVAPLADISNKVIANEPAVKRALSYDESISTTPANAGPSSPRLAEQEAEDHLSNDPSSDSESEEELFDDLDLYGLHIEDRLVNKPILKRKDVKKHRPCGNRHQKERLHEQRRVAQNTKAQKKNRAVQRKKDRISKNCKLEANMVEVNCVVEKPSDPSSAAVVHNQRNRLVKAVEPATDFTQCVAVVPSLPSLPHIPVHDNKFAVLAEHEEVTSMVTEKVDEEQAREGLLVRGVCFIKGIAAKVAAFFKKGVKTIRSIVC